MAADRDVLHIHQKLDNVLLDSRNSAEFMHYAFDAHRYHGRAAYRREQDAAQGVAKRYAIASFKGLDGDFTIRRGGFLYYDLMAIMLHVLPHLSLR